MSDHLEMSGESSLDKNFQIRTNNEGENELYIPCWEEEGSNSTQYHHLTEQTKFFKNKCRHLENHLEQNHRELSSVYQLYMTAESNQKRLLKESQDLKKANRDLLAQLSQARVALDAHAADLHTASKREAELRDRFFKGKEKESQLLGQLQALRSQCELLRKRGQQQGQEQKWKRYYNEQNAKIQQWKAAYEELQLQFDRKSKQLREKIEQIKTINKSCNTHKEDYELKIHSLEAEVQQLRRQLAKSKALSTDYDRQLKDIKLVRDEVSSKNDEIESQNSRLKKALKEEIAKNSRVESNCRQLQSSIDQLKRNCSIHTLELNALKTANGEMKIKISALQLQLSEIKADRDRLTINKNFMENTISSLHQEIANLKRDREGEINTIRLLNDNRIKQMKEIYFNEKLGLQSTISNLKLQIEALKLERRQNSKLQLSVNERMNQLEEEITTLKEESRSWQEKYERITNKYRDQQVAPKECNHLIEINELKQELRRVSEQREQVRSNLNKSNRVIEQLNVRIEEYCSTIQSLRQQKQRMSRQKKKTIEEKQRINSDRNNLLLQIQNLQNEKNKLINQKRQMIFQQKSKNSIEAELLQKIKLFEQKLKQKTAELQVISNKLKDTEQELETMKSKAKEEVREPQRDRNKRYDQKIKQKDKQIRQLEERLQELENEQEQQRGKLKTLQKQNRSKENELAKREKKFKQMQKNLTQLISKIQQLQQLNQSNNFQIQNLKKQLKTQQSLSEKLKTQISRNICQKQNMGQQQSSATFKKMEKQRQQWQQIQKKLMIECKNKDEMVQQLQKKLENLRLASASNDKIHPNLQTEQFLKARIKQLQDQVKSKQETIRRLQVSEKRDDNGPTSSLEELEIEYNRELQALKRLIMYKGYKEDETKKLQEMKNEYETKIQLLLSDYKNMYQEMMIVKEKVLTQRTTFISQPFDISAVEQVWKIKLQQIADERQVLIEKVAMWERKYEELRYLFEAKIQSKEETINLLNLKLSNLEMARPSCQYQCHR